MAKPEFSIFYHPTTTVYIDDNKDFLDSLTMKLASGSFKSFTDPHEGLVYLENQFKLSENFSKGEPMSPELKTPNKLVLPQNLVCNKLNTLNRFAEPSVVVVDFSMPDLNGIDLCSQLSNPNCKKVLLTGVANERQAIHALNSDLIDFYIGKDEEDLPKRLDAIINTLNSRYFAEMMPISNQDAYLQIPFIFDANFADYFEQLCEDLNVSEYYYVTNPGGFLLIDAYGTIHRLIVQTGEELKTSIEEVRAHGANKACLDVIEKMNHIPYFLDDDGKFSAKLLANWETHIHPIDPEGETMPFHCGLVRNASRCLTNYQDYLQMPSNRLH